MKKFIRRPKDPFVARIIMSFVTGEFYCKICKKYYQSRSGIVGHIKKIHSKEIEEKVAAELPSPEKNRPLVTIFGKNVPIGGTEDVQYYNLFCENCGCRFQSENPSKRFHSPSCASLFINRKRMEERDGR